MKPHQAARHYLKNRPVNVAASNVNQFVAEDWFKLLGRLVSHDCVRQHDGWSQQSDDGRTKLGVDYFDSDFSSKLQLFGEVLNLRFDVAGFDSFLLPNPIAKPQISKKGDGEEYCCSCEPNFYDP